MLVEIGGELVGKGINERGELWKVGINQPDVKEFSNNIFTVIALDNKAMATSGNYRNFYERDSVKYSHTISPFTGKPVQHGLLSATVLAEDCMTADAYATAFMVMGMEQSKQFLEANSDLGLEVYFIYDEAGRLKTYTTPSLQQSIKTIN